MYIVNDPGPWQNYPQRQDNIGLTLNQLTQKYINEQLLYERQVEDYMDLNQVQGAGPETPNSSPAKEILTESGEALITQSPEITYIVTT